MLKPFISVLSWTLCLCLFILTQAGRLTPDPNNPIISSVSNKGELSDYTFTFSPATAMPAGTQVYAEFPTQYRSGLGIPISPECSVDCSVDGLIAKFTIPTAVASGASVSVTIKEVENPESKGGTGSFNPFSAHRNVTCCSEKVKLSTVRGVNVLDENIIFGTIGIADSVSNLASPNVVLASGESSATGAIATYSFYFKPSQYIASGSYIKLTISDENFGLAASPVCGAITVNGNTMKGNFVCTTSDRNIIVTGLNTSIPALQDVGLNVQMTNPLVAGTSGTFDIAILRGGTNVIYDERSEVSGVTITPSRMSSVSLTPIDTTRLQSKNKIMTYILRFKPKNALPTGAAIQISLPVGFQLDSTSPYAHYILYGLSDLSESSPVGMALDYTNNLITITNFASMASPDEIGVRLRLQNPSVSGITNIGSITTYVDSTLAVAIDKSQKSMYTTITSNDVPTSYSITTQSLTAGTTLSAVEFLYQPATTVPVGGILKVILPTNYNIGTVISGSCQVKPSSGSYTTASCTSSGSVLSITIPSASAFTSGTVNYFKLNSIVVAPAANSTALFDVTSYQSDATTVIESWSVPLTTVAPGFTTSAAVSLCVGAGKTTALRLSFTPTVAVPSADVQATANSTKGIIEFAFTGMASDLGTGLTSISTVPCQISTGITPISGALVCTLIPGSIPVIRLSNFQSIASGTAVMVKFPKIANPTTVPSGNIITVTAKTTSLTNRIRTDLNQGPVTFSVLTASALTQSGTIASSTYVFSSNVVSTTTQLIFNSGTTSSITGAGYFIVQLPSYDIGWISETSTLTCKLGATTQTCYNYPGADWITITLPSGTTFAANAQITITGLTVPRYSSSSVGGLTLRYVDSTFQETANFVHSAFPTASVPSFNVASFTASLYNSGAVNVLYTFTFTSPNDVPAGSTLTISFPTAYNLLASNPAVEVSSSTLVDLSSSTPVTYTYSFSYVTVTNFQAVTANTVMTILVSGVKNPTGQTTSAGWGASLTYGGGSLVSSTSFQQFDFLAASASYYLTVNSITAYPMNAGVKATYTISFTPVTSIPAYGQIYINFPSMNYKILPSPPTCKVSGAITTYSSCTLSGSSYIITLDTQYSGGNIVVQFSDVLNPSAGTTDLFIITTYYDSLVLDSTETIVTTNRQITIEAAASTITMESLTFDPKNEGEASTYTFSFLPTTALTSDMTIEIIFPSTYDSYLGDTVSCSVSSGLSGNVLCSISNRVVSFVGFSDYTPDSTSPITILIYGVVNPNEQTNADSGQFKIGTRLTTNQYYVDFIAKAGTLETTSAPGWAILWDVDPENLLARTSSDYTFNFSTFSDIPQQSLGGAVRIDLPTEFEMNDQTLTCETTTEDFASTLSCYIQKNSIYVTGNTADYSGNVIIIVRALTNPVSAGTTSDIQLKTYNSFTSEIIERTYKTLDPFSFSYTLPGPLVVVNADETITVERGTESQQYYITMDYPSALDLTYNPITPGFSVTPFYISMAVGSNKASFRITVDESFAMGTYYIQWQVLGDLVPAYYTPIRRTKVIIVSNKDVVISCPTVYPIPKGGDSLPLVFTVPSGPNADFTITAAFETDYPDVSLSTTEIQFTPGQTKGTLLISALSNTTVTDGAILLTLSGTNSDVYTLESEILNFTIVAKDNTAPTISSFAVTATTMNSVNFTFKASEISMAYYVLALKGTDAPTLDQATDLGPAPYQSTASKYRSLLVEDPTALNEITISGLVAETSYTVFLYLVDRGGNNVGPQTVTFTTDDRYDASDFSLRFKQDSLNDAEKQVAINSVAFLLSLKSSQVQLKEYDFSRRALQGGFLQGEDRNLQQSGITLLDLQIMAIPNSTLYPSPYELALMLNDKTSELDDRMNNFDTGYTVTATNFTRYTPSFSTSPSFVSSTLYTASFTAALNNYGNIYVVCVKASEDTGIVPSPYQIWQGFNNLNIEVPSGSVEASTKNSAFTMTCEDLDSDSSYNAYVIGGSAHPGFPDLMGSSKVVTLTFKTLTPPKVVEVVKKSGDLMKGITGLALTVIGLAFIL